MAIRKKLKERFLRAQKSKSLTLLVWTELLLAATLVIGLLVYLNPNIDIIPAPLNQYLFMGTIAVILGGLAIALYVIANRDFVKKTVREKLGTAKRNPRLPALLLVEFFLVMVLVMATFIYLDPAYNVVPWPLNIFTFLVILGIVVYIYNYSLEFRKESKEFFDIKKRW